MAGEEIFLVALAYERAAGGADPAATLDDDPVEEEVVLVAVWFAAMVGFATLLTEALIRTWKWVSVRPWF